jgi:hypothetical protein
MVILDRDVLHNLFKNFQEYGMYARLNRARA